MLNAVQTAAQQPTIPEQDKERGLVFHLSLGQTQTAQQRLTHVRDQVADLCRRYGIQPLAVDVTDYGTEVRGELTTETACVELRAW